MRLLRSNRANPSLAATTVPGHFAPAGPVLVHLVRAVAVLVHFAPQNLFAGILPRPDHMLDGPGLSVRSHDPEVWHNLFWGILSGLHRPDLCPFIFLRRSCLELLERIISRWLSDFGLTLIGSNLVAHRRFPCGRRQILRASS